MDRVQAVGIVLLAWRSNCPGSVRRDDAVEEGAIHGSFRTPYVVIRALNEPSIIFFETIRRRLAHIGVS